MKSKIINTILVVCSLIAGYFLYNTGIAILFPQFDIEPLAVQDSLIQLSKQTVSIQSLAVKDILLENNELKEAVEKYKTETKAHLSIIAQYKLQKVVISTRDTIYVDSTGDTRLDKLFNYQHKSELHLQGYFQTNPPFNLYVKHLSLNIKPEILIGQDKNGVWTTFIHTNSDLLTIKDIQVKVRPYARPFMNLHPKFSLFYFYGFYFDSNARHEIGGIAKIRIWNIQPFALISTNRIQVGLQYNL